MRATFLLLALILLSCHAPAPALALPPRPPVRCAGGGGCVLSNAYGAWSSDRADCPVSAVAYPASEPEVVAAVARASAAGARVKVVSGFAHTIPKLACPGGGGNASTLLISTARLAGVEVDAAARTVTADAGAPLRAVIDAVEARGLSLAAAPYWEGVSVGGLVSTGSHGSSWWGRGGAVHDHVVGLRLVAPAAEADGWATVLPLRRGDELFPAALVSLGLLGVVTKVTSDQNVIVTISYGFSQTMSVSSTKKGTCFIPHSKQSALFFSYFDLFEPDRRNSTPVESR